MHILSHIHPTKPPNTGAPEYPDADDLSRRADLREIAAQLWGQPAKHHAKYDQHHARWRAGDDTPSFTVYADGFKDFGGDGESGDVYNFLQRELNKSYSESVAWLSRYLDGATVHTASRHAAPVTARNEPPAAAQQQEARRLIAECQRRLWADTDAGRAALDYLHGRGLNDETIRARGYGLNPDWARSSYRNPDTGKLAKLAPGITIPYVLDGVVWALRVRTLPQFNGLGLDKYMSFPGSKFVGTLYGGDGLEANCNVLFVEGEFDCAIAQQELGDGITVVTLGGAGSHLARRWQERLQSAGQVYALMDNDAAGQKATARLVEQLPDLIALHLPTGKDVTEYVQSGGDLRAWFDTATAPAGEPTAATIGIEMALNAHGSTGENIIWRSACALRAHGRIPTTAESVMVDIDTLMDGAALAGFSIGRKALQRYASDSAREGTILHPYDEQQQGCNFVLNSLSAIHNELKRRHKVQLREHFYRAWAVERTDPATGKPYTLQPVVADLEPLALEDAGLSAEEAVSVAELLKDAPLDKETRRLRKGAAEKANGRYAEFCELLADERVIALPPEMDIANEHDLKRAQARAWHAAELPNFQSKFEQMWALGVTKRTLNKMLDDAGVERVENIREVELEPGNVRQQVNNICRVLRARVLGCVVYIDDDHAPEEKPFTCEGAEADLAQGRSVALRLQLPNEHRIVELPPARQSSPRVKPEGENAEGKPKPLPEAKRQRGHYSPYWVRGQLELRYRLTHKRNPPIEATVRELIAALIPDPFLATAIELGAVVRKVEPHAELQ